MPHLSISLVQPCSIIVAFNSSLLSSNVWFSPSATCFFIFTSIPSNKEPTFSNTTWCNWMASLKIFVHSSLELMWHKHPWLDTWTIDLIKVDFLLWPKSKLSNLLLAECEFFQRRIKGNRSLYLGHLEQAMSKAQYAICLATLCLILVLDGSYTLVCYRRQNWQNSYFPPNFWSSPLIYRQIPRWKLKRPK